MSKSCLRIFTLLFFSLLMVSPQLSAQSPIRTVRVGFFESEGYQELHEDGTRSGYGYDFLQMVEQYSNLKFEYVRTDNTWLSYQNMLKEGQIDLLTCVHLTDKRSEDFLFTVPIGINSLQINVRSDDDRFEPYEFHSFNGKRIGMIEGSTANHSIEQYAHEHGFSFKPVFYDNVEQLHMALAQQEIDAFASNSLVVNHNEKTVANFHTDYFYAIVQKNDTSLLNTINNAVIQMNHYDGEWMSHLLQKNYYTQPKLEFTGKEKAYIQAHSTENNAVVIAVDNLWKPFAYRDKNDNYLGIIPDYWQQVFEMSGMKFRFLQHDYEIYDPANLRADKADIYLGTSDDPTIAENKGFLVSPSFMNIGASLLYLRSNNDPIKRVAFCEITPFLNSHFQLDKGQTSVTYHNSDEALKALQRGWVDAILCYTHDAQRLVNNDIKGELIYQIEPGIDIDIRACIPVDADHTLLSITSKCINMLQGPPTENIVSRNLTLKATSFSISDWIAVHSLFSAIIIAIILTLVFLLCEQLIRAHQRRQVTLKQHQQMQKINMLNNELKKNQEALKEAIQRADAANRSKTDFLFSMSHDIRTPMNAIMGFSQLIDKNFDDREKCRDYMTKIESSSAVLLSLINDVLEMARIESGKTELDEIPCSTATVREEINSVYSELMKQKHIDFKIESTVKTMYVFQDDVKIHEIMLNLVSNSYKYTPEGGTITLKFNELPCDKPGYCTLQTILSDTGIGMSEDFLPHIFEAFTREQNTTKSKIQGTGLGMPIVKKLVDMMGGTITVESKLGKGTTFTLTLTLRVAQESMLEKPAQQAMDEISFAGKRVLLAEDNELNAEIAEAILTDVGFEVDRAEDGVECVDMLVKSDPGYYDLILMDIQMPNLNGYEATQRIRNLNDSEKADITIIAMTANAFDEDRKNALDAGMDGHLAKPIEIPKLIEELSMFING